MDFDQMLESWRSQDTASSFDVNRDALRQALQAEGARVRQELRSSRRSLWWAWAVGTGMAVFAGFWIAICITNGWSVVYVAASVLSFGMFAFGAGAMWKGRVPRREPARDFDNTLQEEVRRSLALVDDQLSLSRYMFVTVLGSASLFVGALLFSWTVNSSQNIPDSSSGGWWIAVLLVVWLVWGAIKAREEMREAKPKLEQRQRHLRELLVTLDGRE